VITTLAAIVANVYMTKTDNVITPSQQIITDWNAEISAAIATQDAKINNLESNFAPDYSELTFPISYGTYCTHDARMFMASQDIEEPEAWNSGHWTPVNVMGQVGSAVLYTPQGLNNAQKIQAANNIGAVSTQWGQTLTDDQKQAVRSKINLPLIDWDANYTDSQIQIAQNNFAISELAPKYKPTGVSYAVGDIRSFNGDTYFCNTAIEADAGNFDYDKWTWIPPVPQPVSYGKDQTTGFGALTPKQKATARNNIGMGIVPELYGAKGDGETDDKDALGMAIATACSNGVPLYFSPGKTYLTSGHLYVTKRVNIYGNGATIKATGTEQNQVILVESEEGQFPTVQGKGLIENLTIDANGRNIGLNVFKAQGWELQNLDIFGFTNIGALIRNNFEIFAHNIRIAGSNNPNSKGMQVQASDSRFENIVTKNVGTGVVNIGSCNFYTHVHSWNTASEIVPTSVMIENQADLHLEESYIDTCAIGIKQASNLPVCVSGLVVYRNNDYMDDDFCPVVFGVTSAVNAEKIKGYNIINNSTNDLYDLFDVDVSRVNRFDWVDNNDKSILKMGKVPKGVTLDSKAPVITEQDSESSAIKTFPDGADNMPMGLTVGIEPVQDLHGQENPYPAGGGKNKLPMASSRTVSNVVFTVNSDGSITAVGTANANGSFDFYRSLTKLPSGIVAGGTFTLSCGNVIDKIELLASTNGTSFNQAIGSIAQVSTLTFTMPSDSVGLLARVFISAGNTYNVTIYPQIESGSTATAYAPYSNICPISGWTGADVTRTGKNLLDVSNAVNATNVVSSVDADGTINFKDVSPQWSSPYIGKMYVKKEQTYIISASIVYGRLGFSTEPTRVPTTGVNVPDITPTIGTPLAIMNKNFNENTFVSHYSGFIYLYYCSDSYYQEDHTTFSTPIWIEVGSSASEYTPYVGQEYSINFPTSAGTVYGGTLTVNKDGTGSLVVDRAMVDLGTRNYTYGDNYKIFTGSLSGIKGVSTSQVPNMISSMYKAVSWNVGATDATKDGIVCILPDYNQLRLRNLGYTDPSTFKSAMSGVQLVYELATPVTYDLTCSQVTTLLGLNNVWADTGNILSVDYPADTKLYIDNKIAEILASMNA
jgi:hypothetical protein